jgi:hypothetical protein
MLYYFCLWEYYICKLFKERNFNYETNLNSTGSFYQDDIGNYWSYNTQLTCYFKDYRLVNKTFYSMTTRKHQAQIIKQENDIDIINEHYGVIRPGQDLMFYLQELYYRLDIYKAKRNSKHKQAKIDECQKQINLIKKVLN